MALILALFTGAVSAVDSFSDLTGEDWFSADIDPNLPQTDWESVANDMSADSDESWFDEVYGYLQFAYLIVKTLISALKGVLFIGVVLNEMFYYEINGQNVVPIVSAVINIGVWIVYVIGLYQLKHGDSIRHYW